VSRLSLTLILFLVLRFALMALFPVMGDEAYYFYWGMHPSAGYYDLPPMIGWWLIPFVQVSLAPFWLRLPNLISLVLISLSICEWLKLGVSKDRAKWIAGIFAILPLPFLAFLMFPDIPLLFFGYFSAYLFFRAVTHLKHEAYSFLFSGSLLGAAVLSKYFAVFLLPAYVIWFFLQKKKNYWGIAWFTAGAAPFAIQHLLWNKSHCWSNIVFNLVTRQNANDGPLYQVVGLFILYLGLASVPFWNAIRKPILSLELSESDASELSAKTWVRELSRFVGLLWMVPLVIFAITAMKGKGQGLHWLIFVLPFFIMWVGLRLNLAQLQKAFVRLSCLTGGLALVALLISISPEKTIGSFFQHRFQFEFAEMNHADELIESLLPELKFADGIFTEGYTLSSVLNYDFQRYARTKGLAFAEVSVWGSGSRFGREFDWTTDFSMLDGKTLVIITPGEFSHGWAPYFATFKTETKVFRDRKIFVTVGTGFKSVDYLKNEYRKPIETYYGQAFGTKCSLWDLTHPN
jgi:hypothetical protein